MYLYVYVSQVPSEIVENMGEEEENRINKMKTKLARHLSEEGVGREEALQAAEKAGQEAIVSPQLDEDDPLDNDSPADIGECECRSIMLHVVAPHIIYTCVM